MTKKQILEEIIEFTRYLGTTGKTETSPIDGTLDSQRKLILSKIRDKCRKLEAKI